MSKSLKPCPFCGCHAELHTWETEDKCVSGYDVICSNADCTLHEIDDSAEDAIRRWNTRPEVAIPRDLAIAIEKDLRKCLDFVVARNCAFGQGATQEETALRQRINQLRNSLGDLQPES